ncbi:MAG: hypothetical protein O3A47_00685 [Chloroflexi bacterium]|nr:hypothetical protein [Chloroflexota bacterium]
MDFEVGPAIGAGVIAGGVMAMLLYMGIGMMPGQMKMNLFYMLGTMMVKDRTMAYVAGAIQHAMMSVVFGLVHVALFTAFDLESSLAAWGLLFGLGHWVVSGIGLGMIPVMHPLMRRGELQAPGAFAMSYPPMTVMGFFMLHIVFGVLMGALYAAFT